MPVKLLLENAIGKAGCILKNGTGGGAPALDENSDWPTSNTLIRSRGSDWRAYTNGGGAHGGVYLFDYDFGSAVNIGAAGFLHLRLYPPTAFGTILVEAYHGSSYPPSTAVSLGMFATLGDNLKEITPVSDRYWRVEVSALDVDSNPIEISGKPWLVEAANIVTIVNPRAPLSTITSEVRRHDVRLPGGESFSFTPDVNPRANLGRTVALVIPTEDGSLAALLRSTIAPKSERVAMIDYEGAASEPTIDNIKWERVVGAVKSLQLDMVGGS